MLTYHRETIGELECVHAVPEGLSGRPDAVVIICHGFGAPGTDLIPIGQELVSGSPRLANVRFIFPAAPIELDPMFDSRAWWMIDIEKFQQLQMTGEVRQMGAEKPPELPDLRAAIEQIIRHVKSEWDLDSSKIVVGGFSQGSMLMTDVAIHFLETLGGLIIWSGALINETEWTESAKGRARLNIFQSHGNQDTLLPLATAENLQKMLTVTGHNVDYLEFNGAHTIPPEAIDGARRLIESVVS